MGRGCQKLFLTYKKESQNAKNDFILRGYVVLWQIKKCDKIANYGVFIKI